MNMASSSCWKCLSRPNASQLINNPTLRLPAAATAAFSTTQSVQKNPLAAKKTSNYGLSTTKGGKTLKIKKKAPPKPTGKPPATGERKALRKRIVLSNTNALEVDLEDLDEGILGDVNMVGKVVGLKDRTVDSLRASEAFKITQQWGLFRRPAVLIREESVICANMLEEARTRKSTKRLLIDGDRGTGKSLMLLHAMATAFVKGWVVLNIPEGMFPLVLHMMDLTNEVYSTRSCQRRHRILSHSQHKPNTLFAKCIYCSLARPHR